MQSLIRSKSAGVTGGRGTAGAGPGRDLLYSAKRPISVLAQNLWGIPSVLIQVLFSLPICLLQGGVAKRNEGMKPPFCYVAKTLT